MISGLVMGSEGQKAETLGVGVYLASGAQDETNSAAQHPRSRAVHANVKCPPSRLRLVVGKDEGDSQLVNIIRRVEESEPRDRQLVERHEEPCANEIKRCPPGPKIRPHRHQLAQSYTSSVIKSPREHTRPDEEEGHCDEADGHSLGRGHDAHQQPDGVEDDEVEQQQQPGEKEGAGVVVEACGGLCGGHETDRDRVGRRSGGSVSMVTNGY